MNILQCICGTSDVNPESSWQIWVSISAILSAIAAGLAVYVSYVVYQGQKHLSQKQFIIPLWEYMCQLNEINPANPNPDDVINAINTLELVAVSCTKEIVDKDLINMTFKNQFIKHVDNINACGPIAACNNQTGKQLLQQCPVVLTFYNNLH